MTVLASFMAFMAILVIIFLLWIWYITSSWNDWGKDWSGNGQVSGSAPYSPPPPPPKPKVYKDMGSHHNPFSLSPAICHSKFEQMDERTWQCPDCQLVHFEKSQEPMPYEPN